MDKVYKYYELCSIKAPEKRFAPLYSFLNVEGRRKLLSEQQEAQYFKKDSDTNALEIKKGGKDERRQPSKYYGGKVMIF